MSFWKSREGRIISVFTLLGCVVGIVCVGSTITNAYNAKSKTVPTTSHESGCMPLEPPAHVFCTAETTALIDDEAKELCYLTGPPRWRFTTVAGAKFTLVGGKCFTAFVSE